MFYRFKLFVPFSTLPTPVHSVERVCISHCLGFHPLFYICLTSPQHGKPQEFDKAITSSSSISGRASRGRPPKLKGKEYWKFNELNWDQLIAQSLICLRACLEGLRVKGGAKGGIKDFISDELIPHKLCSSSFCKVEYIAQVKANICMYLEELSRVFFKKVNMRVKRHWWLSTLYSFCIQSLVRICLLKLETRLLTWAFVDPKNI